MPILIYQLAPNKTLRDLINSDDSVAMNFFAAKNCKSKGLTDFHVLVAQISEPEDCEIDWDSIYQNTQHFTEDWTSRPNVQKLHPYAFSTSVGDILVHTQNGSAISAVRIENIGFSEIDLGF